MAVLFQFQLPEIDYGILISHSSVVLKDLGFLPKNIPQNQVTTNGEGFAW